MWLSSARDVKHGVIRHRDTLSDTFRVEACGSHRRSASRVLWARALWESGGGMVHGRTAPCAWRAVWEWELWSSSPSGGSHMLSLRLSHAVGPCPAGASETLALGVGAWSTGAWRSGLKGVRASRA